MQITITGRHAEITPYLKQYTIKKLEKLTRFDHQILKGEVVIFRDRAYEVAEGKIHAGHFLLTAKGHGNDAYEAVNDLTDKLGVQLERHIEKLRTRRRRASPGKTQHKKP